MCVFVLFAYELYLSVGFSFVYVGSLCATICVFVALWGRGGVKLCVNYIHAAKGFCKSESTIV